eukprot:gnl/TRDRNA2_/TRDRNA2_175042_c0_seq2.p1 gnl/TRDRNA2_/TRDRNA2_175042_c0~~gnl/TRDRNA2_/TRDRNA2_175042_c0_seq2.p1  ORF type:complete len:216 (-),score=19.09 gnl/TRDRNA2_/TRDRNA2_175042_c0_seq2:118-765(-)
MRAIPLFTLLIVRASAHTCRDGNAPQCVPFSSTSSTRSAQDSDLDCFLPKRYHRHKCPKGSRVCCRESDIIGHLASNSSQDWSLPVSVGVCIILLFGIVGCSWHHLRQRRKKALQVQPLIPRSHAEKCFPEVPIDGQSQCVICLGDIESTGRQLQCGHAFHSDCILDWWAHIPRTELECPTCRQLQKIPQVTSADAEPPDAAKSLTADIVGQVSV